MSHLARQVPRVGLIALGLAVGLVTLGTAYAVTSSSFKYDSPKTGYLTLHAMDLIPDSDTTADNYNNQWEGGLTSSTGDCFNASIHLPHNARMKQITYFYQSGATGDLYGEIRRLELATGNSVGFSPAANIPNNSNVYSSTTYDIDPANERINNKDFAYGLGVCLSDSTIRAVRIKYTYTSAGD